MKYVRLISSTFLGLALSFLVLHGHILPTFAAAAAPGPSGASPTTAVIDSGGATTPIFLTNYPPTGSASRSTTLTYTVGGSLTGCVRVAIATPSNSGITVSTNQPGGGATDLPLTSGTVVNEKLTISISTTAIPRDLAGINVIISCGSSYTNSIAVLIGRQPGLLLTVDGSTSDRVDSIAVPTSGTVTKSYLLAYTPQGIASGCLRYAINPGADVNGTGITANLSTDQAIDATHMQETLTLTFAPGALTADYNLQITATCLTGSSQYLTPIYRRVIVLKNGIPLSIGLVNSDGSQTVDSTTVTIPAAGTYTGVFPLRYTKGAGALNCKRLAVATPPSNVTISSNPSQADTVLLQPLDITNVTEEDVAINMTNPTAPLSYTVPITIQCGNTAPLVRTFIISIVRQRAASAAQLSIGNNGHWSENNLLSDTDMIDLPVTGAAAVPFQVNWTVPASATGCSLYREDIYTSGAYRTGQGPLSAPATSQGNDPYSYAGTSVTGSGFNPSFTISFAANEIPSGSPYKMQYAVYCTSDPTLYSYVTLTFARALQATLVGTYCINGKVVENPYSLTAQDILHAFVPGPPPPPPPPPPPADDGSSISPVTYTPPQNTLVVAPLLPLTQDPPILSTNPCQTTTGGTGGTSTGTNPDTGGAGTTGTTNNNPYPYNFAEGSRRL